MLWWLKQHARAVYIGLILYSAGCLLLDGLLTYKTEALSHVMMYLPQALEYIAMILMALAFWEVEKITIGVVFGWLLLLLLPVLLWNAGRRVKTRWTEASRWLLLAYVCADLFFVFDFGYEMNGDWIKALLAVLLDLMFAVAILLQTRLFDRRADVQADVGTE